MPSCPMCAEQVPPGASTCPFCKESLAAGGAGPDVFDQPPRKSNAVVIVIVVAVVGFLCMIPVIAAIALPNLIDARKHGNEAAAIGGLKTITISQTLFREADKEADGVLDYAGSLQELSDATLIDSVLGSGLKQGYVFQVQTSSTDPEFLWMATASPSVPGKTGDRYFVTNHAGVVYYSEQAPFSFADDCSIPPDALPVGRR